MPSIGDVIEVVLEQSYFDQQVINVHQFVITDITGDGDLEDIAEEFRDGIIPYTWSWLGNDFDNVTYARLVTPLPN